MTREHGLLVVMGLAVALGAPVQLWADGRCDRNCDHVVVQRCGNEPEGWGGMRAGRASWVMVFALDREGRLFRTTHGRTGEYVSRDLPLAQVLAGCPAGYAGAPYEWQIVVSSDVPFVTPQGTDRDVVFHVGRRGWRQAEDSRRLCRMLGLRPERVRVTVHPVARRSDGGCRHDRDSFAARVWVDVSAGGRVYVDGSFRGRGLAALLSVPPGPRRLTMVSENGHKYSGWVSFPLTPYPCGPACAVSERACP